MSHSHLEHTFKTPMRVRRVLFATLFPLLILTLVGLFMLWPSGSLQGQMEVSASQGEYLASEVVSVDETAGLVSVLLDEKQETVDVQTSVLFFVDGISPGDRLRVIHSPEAASFGSPYVAVDFIRTMPLWILGIVYTILVVAVARWRGLSALLGLALALGIIGLFTLPALLEAQSPVLVALVSASLIMFSVLPLAHGFNARTATALLGTLIGLIFTGLLTVIASGAAHLSVSGEPDAELLPILAPGMSLGGIALCGVILAGLGILNDVTITQASAVWELKHASKDLSRRQLFTRGMRIGRDHIASTVYTLAFAYVGAALPLMLLITLYDTSFWSSIGSGELAQEVIRTLIGSIGLTLAIPITTFIAALIVSSADQDSQAQDLKSENLDPDKELPSVDTPREGETLPPAGQNEDSGQQG